MTKKKSRVATFLESLPSPVDRAFYEPADHFFPNPTPNKPMVCRRQTIPSRPPQAYPPSRTKPYCPPQAYPPFPNPTNKPKGLPEANLTFLPAAGVPTDPTQPSRPLQAYPPTRTPPHRGYAIFINLMFAGGKPNILARCRRTHRPDPTFSPAAGVPTDTDDPSPGLRKIFESNVTDDPSPGLRKFTLTLM
ncbi:hypothetical protein BB561_006787 [Smittium simulii]|uniref:Uncharacterized protein n=1 Tax=Smittium simulii TaxID=133385 RepID=A0A2T9Y1J6_9FUNG|nr:hypothetical protein BB561_006787 [Smittium simulii]